MPLGVGVRGDPERGRATAGAARVGKSEAAEGGRSVPVAAQAACGADPAASPLHCAAPHTGSKQRAGRTAQSEMTRLPGCGVTRLPGCGVTRLSDWPGRTDLPWCKRAEMSAPRGCTRRGPATLRPVFPAGPAGGVGPAFSVAQATASDPADAASVEAPPPGRPTCAQATQQGASSTRAAWLPIARCSSACASALARRAAAARRALARRRSIARETSLMARRAAAVPLRPRPREPRPPFKPRRPSPPPPVSSHCPRRASARHPRTAALTHARPSARARHAAAAAACISRPRAASVVVLRHAATAKAQVARPEVTDAATAAAERNDRRAVSVLPLRSDARAACR
eukprot:scaffold18081_cov89-Isochrysis_galbana.AAC.3